MNTIKLTRVRSWLFTPASRPDRFDKAAASEADVSIIDLEDSVAPADKAEAANGARSSRAAGGGFVRAGAAHERTGNSFRPGRSS